MSLRSRSSSSPDRRSKRQKPPDEVRKQTPTTRLSVSSRSTYVATRSSERLNTSAGATTNRRFSDAAFATEESPLSFRTRSHRLTANTKMQIHFNLKPTDTGEEKDEDLSKKTEGRLTRHRNRKPPIKFRDGVYEVTKMITTNDGKYWLEFP